MKAKQLLALLLAGTLSITLVGCNESLEEETPTEQPDSGSGDGSPDNGSGDNPGNGSDGDSDGDEPGSGDSGEGEPPVGTWENKDEDGDGVLDENDDFPFDADRSEYPMVVEQEFNNNSDVATLVEYSLPFKVSGRLAKKNDLDFFAVELEKGKPVTILLSSTSTDLDPGMAVMNSSGVAIQAWEPKLTPLGRYKRAIQVNPKQSGTFYIVINDKQFRGSDHYDYSLNVFLDKDVDAIDDSIESAFSFESYSQDSDSDGIFDGTEFYVYKRDDVFAHDFDADGTPNWLDGDSDGDGLSDQLEGASDLEQDGYGNFVDIDSDNVAGNDAEDAGELGYPRDHDGDGLYSFYDLDDDNDLILDVHDIEPLKAARNREYGSGQYIDISSVTYLLDGQKPISGVQIAGKKHRASGDGLTSGYLLFDIAGSKTPVNVAVQPNADASIDFIMPEGATAVAFSANHVRSTPFSVEFKNQYVPIIEVEEPVIASANDTVTLKGRNFTSDTRVVLNDIEVEPSEVTATELIVTVPSDARTGKLWLSNSYGSSNKVALAVVSQTTLTLSNDLNFGANKVLAVSGAVTAGVEVDLSGGEAKIPVSNDNYQKIMIFLGPEEEYVFNLLYLGESEIVVTANHIATATAWTLSSVDSNLPTDTLRTLFNDVSHLEKVKEFQTYIERNLQDVEALNSDTFTTLKWAAADAITASQKQ